MSLYPTWGCGQKIRLRDWYVSTTGTPGTLRIHRFRSASPRFGGYRSMDVLRLWAMDGMDSATSKFYGDLSAAMERDREVRYRRQLFEELKHVLNDLSRQNLLKVLVRGDISSALPPASPSKRRRRSTNVDVGDAIDQSASYRLYKYDTYEPVPPVAEPDEGAAVDSAADAWFEFAPPDRSGVNGSVAFYESLLYDRLSSGVRRLEPSALHQGFNDRSGIRRWMLDGGLRFEQFRRDTSNTEPFQNFGELVSDFETMQHAVSRATLVSDFVDVMRVAAAAVVCPPPHYQPVAAVFQASGYSDAPGQRAVQLFDVHYDRNGRPNHLGPMRAQFAQDEKQSKRAADGLSFQTLDTKRIDLKHGFGICGTTQDEDSYAYLAPDAEAYSADQSSIAHAIIPIDTTSHTFGDNRWFSRHDDGRLNMILVNYARIPISTPEPLSQIAFTNANQDILAVFHTVALDDTTGFDQTDTQSILFESIVYPLHFLTPAQKQDVYDKMNDLKTRDLVCFNCPPDNLNWYVRKAGQADFSFDKPYAFTPPSDATSPTWRSSFNLELYDDACIASERSTWPRSHDAFSSLLLRPLPFYVDEAPVNQFLADVTTAAQTAAQTMFSDCFELVPHETVPTGIPLLCGGETFEFYAAGDGISDGWSIGGTPMTLIDGLELGVGYVDTLRGGAAAT